MNLKSLAAIIPMISVIVMILWGVIGHAWGISWVAVVCGGIGGAIIRIIDKNRQDNEKNQR